ncbi:DNA-binding response regulator [Dokdonia sinensis]|uniref:DNA-binding response regulator n=1 Tax=Dokdonia sinensis TaxID=2479847 RepID=A0A3M0GG29_9FLAO|nr:LytTR family DNA-binding domain-containing protein [Dokdonia sinensis]RMB63477.1 DNA-binding response regulator [Dokdonia sinensis]
MNILLIDDENKALALLKTLLTEHCPQVVQIWTADTLENGVAIIREHKPDLVFLDIEMPEHSGLEILDFFKDERIDFNIVFCTAYNEYAIEAFKINAVDYLLKPVDIQELQGAIQKTASLISQKDIGNNILQLQASLQMLSKRKLALEVPRGVLFVEYTDILYFEADGMYTNVFLKNKRKECIAKPLKYFVDQLSGNEAFYRPHRSYLVNVGSICEFVKKDGGFLIMDDKKKIAISRDKKDSFFELISNLTK